jgi:carboxypeptidase family protein
VAAGSYKVRFASFGAPGYVPQFYKGKGTFAEANAVAVSGGSTTAGIDAEMQEGAAVTGTVTDSLSVPIEGLQVCTATSQFMVGECAMTDAAGHYTLAGLAPGEYRIVFTNNDGCGTEGCARLNYLVQYWNNKSSFGEATPIVLSAGEIESNINAKMQKGASISGAVVNTAKSPLGGIQVCAMAVGGGFGDCRQTGSNGNYSIVGLSTGEYKISFQPEEGSYYLTQYYDDKDRFNQADVLAVIAGEAKAGIGAELKEGGAVTGTVTDVAHNALQGLQVCAYEATGPQFGEPSECAPTDAGGEYRLRLAAGSYKIQFTNNFCGSEGCEQLNYVGQYYDGAKSWGTAAAVGVTKGATTAGIDAQMVEGAEISGTVTDVGEAPLKGIQVCAQGASEEQGGFGGCAQTDAAGEYTIPGLAAGDYKVEFSGSSCGFEGCFQLNYVRQFYDGKTGFEEADVLSLAAGDVETGIDAQMVEGAEISGTVTDTGEEPLEGISVCARNAAYESDEAGGCAFTDANGEYTITAIPAGSFRVEFSGESCNEEEGCFQLNYVRQFYDGKSFDEADVLVLTAGDVETGIDAQMAEGATIEGTVTDTAEVPIEGIQVCVQDASGEGEESAGCAQTDANGEYTITAIPAGSLKVEFRGESCNEEEGCFQLNWVRQYYDGKSSFDEADVLSLSAGDVETGIDAQMAEGATIEGTVTDAATEDPIEGIQVCVQDASGEGEESAGCAQTDAAGEYTITAIPAGSFKVEFSGESCDEEGCFQTNWVRQYYDGKSNFDDADVLSLSAGDVEAGIDAALEEGGAVSGRVVDAVSEAPIEGLVVCADPAEGEGIGGCDSTDPTGDYLIGGLPAGEYKVEFSNVICPEDEECSQSYYLHQWFDEEPGWDQADPVTVLVGQTTPEVDAALEEGGAIGGTVTDTLAAPIQESGVCAYALGASEEEPTECTETGELGHYMLVVPAGTYKVGFYYLDWPSGYYNGKAALGIADPVTVTLGATHGGIDAVLRPAAPVNTAPPSLTGTPAVGEVFSCSKGSWDHDPASFAYAWKRDATPIPGQSAPTYTVQTADPGHGISCEVTASNAGGSATAKSNTLQVPTTPAPPPPAGEAPTEVGIATASATAKVKNGKAMIRLACKAAVSCKGVVKLFSGSQIGKASFSIPAGQTKTIAVKLTSKGKQLLEKAGKKGLTVTLKGSGVRQRKLTLKPS